MPNATAKHPKELTQAENLPSLPAVAMEVLRLSRDDRAEFEDYARIITKDPALAAKLLKLANSPLFGLSRPVTELKEATSVLGLRTVQIMALGFSLVGGLPKDGGAKSFRHDEYWRRSLVLAVAAREIALKAEPELSDEAFLCGLLSHIGQLVMAHAMPMKYERVLRGCSAWPDAETERKAIGFDHHAVADTLLATWNIPDLIRGPVATWGDADSATSTNGDVEKLSRILAAAAHMMSLTCAAGGGLSLAALHQAAETLAVERQQMDTLVLVLEHRSQDVMDVLEMSVSKPDDHQTLLIEARAQMVEQSLGAAADLQRAERRAGSLETQVRRLKTQLTKDPLTGLANRQHLDEMLSAEIEIRRRRSADGRLGLIRIEIDGFAELAENRGDIVAEEVLRVVAQAIGGTSRATDVPARVNEEEFAVIAPNTDADGLLGFGERLRKFVADLEIHAKGRTHRVTLSIGGALVDEPENAVQGRELFEAAGTQLAVAARSGDRVAIQRTPIDA